MFTPPLRVTVLTPPLRVMFRFRAVLAQITVWNEKVGATTGPLAPSPGITLRGEGSTNGANPSSTRHVQVLSSLGPNDGLE